MQKKLTEQERREAEATTEALAELEAEMVRMGIENARRCGTAVQYEMLLDARKTA